MPRLDRIGVRAGLVTVLAAAALGCAKEIGFRFTAPIEVEASAAFIQMPLSAGVYGRSVQADLGDLRVVDARGERVPFAVLAPRVARPESVEQQRDAVLYPLPGERLPGGGWSSPVEVTVDGDRISVTRRDQAVRPARRSGGWLIDLGERRSDDPPPHALRVRWTGPDEFSATYSFETSDDLNVWRDGGSGQFLALASQSGPLTQAVVKLPSSAGRFVRLVWADPATAPALAGAKVIAAAERNVALDPPAEMVLAPSAEPAGGTPAGLHFDLGGVLPVVEIDLRLAPGTRVAPVQLEGRTAADQPWQALGSAVFYRLERGGAEASTSPPLGVAASVRYLRVVPDSRAAALDPAETKLAAKVQLASLVFANQGQAPFELRVGSLGAPAGGLPISALVPALDEERGRFGRARLGGWSEVASVARAAESRQQLAAIRPWALWAVLLAGVAGLGFMVWRLSRGARG